MTIKEELAEEPEPPRSSSRPGGVDMFIEIEDAGWAEAVRSPERLIERAVFAALQGQLEGEAELSVILTNDARIRELNAHYRDKDKATNVLSFPVDQQMPEGPEVLGDVVIALETVLAEAEEQGKLVPDHLSHLVVHGVLHLLGFDHIDAAEAEEMEALERQILQTLSIADPYADTVLDAGGQAA